MLIALHDDECGRISLEVMSTHFPVPSSRFFEEPISFLLIRFRGYRQITYTYMHVYVVVLFMVVFFSCESALSGSKTSEVWES